MRFAIIALFASSGFGQPMDRVLHFTYAETDQELEEIATDIRGITEIPLVSVDTAQRTLTLHGTAAEIAVAEWLLNQWDHSAPPQLPENPTAHQYRLSSDDIVRVFRLAHTPSRRSLQEVATVVRSIADIRRLFTYSASSVITLRGGAAQIALAEWLVNQLDQPASQADRGTASPEYHPSGTTDDVVRVFYIGHRASLQVLQEIATDVRTIGDIRRLFTYGESTALIARGTAAEIALVEWLVNQLDQPANQAARGTASPEYHPSGTVDDVVRVFYPAYTATQQALQEITTNVRSIANIRRFFTYSQSTAVIVRGTAAEMAFAEWLLNELDQPANQPPRTPAPHEYRPSGTVDDVVRVFFLAHAESPQRLQQIATEVRSTTEVKRIFTYTAPRAMTVRGTAAQIAMADKMIAERDR